MDTVLRVVGLLNKVRSKLLMSRIKAMGCCLIASS